MKKKRLSRLDRIEQKLDKVAKHVDSLTRAIARAMIRHDKNQWRNKMHELGIVPKKALPLKSEFPDRASLLLH